MSPTWPALRAREHGTVHAGALASFAVTVALLLAAPAAASAETGWWQVGSEVAPTYLPPKVDGEPGAGDVIVTVTNRGDAPIDGAGETPVLLSEKLPAGLVATSITPNAPGHKTEPTCSLATLQCEYTGVLTPYERLEVKIGVRVEVEQPSAAITTLPDEVSVRGGGAPSVSSVQQLTLSGRETPFGVAPAGYELGPSRETGAPATQAGSHPFQLTTALTFNQVIGKNGARQPVALPKNLRFSLPPGLVGDPDAVAQCTPVDFAATVKVTNLCPPGSVIGAATVTVYEPDLPALDQQFTVPVFNLVPAQGEPARFGFEVLGRIFLTIDTAVAAGGDYGVVASVQNATEDGGLLSSQVTLWGDPGDPRHNQSRGWECIQGGYHFLNGEVHTPCPAEPGLPQTPFLTLPTSCAPQPASEPFVSSVQAESWAQRGFTESTSYAWAGPLGEPLGLEGCGQLSFTPAIEVSPEERTASTPSGLDVDVRLPQGPLLEANPEGRAEADVREATVTLPAGLQVSPSAANGLQACPEGAEGGFEGVGFTGFKKFSGLEPPPGAATFTPTFRFIEEGGMPPSCPEASKVGTVRIRTPLLPDELEGYAYLAAQDQNPFGSLVALYIVAQDKKAGVLVKLAGEVTLNEATGQISTSFKNTPQLPFEELKLHLFGGQRASLSTPTACGSYTTSSAFAAWSGAAAEPVSEPFDVASGADGGACPPSPLGFSPAFDAQSANTQAGAFSPFEVELARPDGDQALTGVTVALPPGVAALLSSVAPCQEPPAGVEWSCGEDSLIGHSTAWSGLGSEPVVLGGDVYLTSGYNGAPFGLLVRTHAAAGPFDLGWVNVRSRINVNPETAAVTVTTDPGPHGDALITMLKGIPVQLKRLQVTVDRPGFEFNPTSCDPMAVTGTLSGSEGASAGVSSRFQVGGCESLPFHPVLTAAVGGHASKANGTGLDVKIMSQGLGVANIKKVDLQLPVQLPSRQSTLNQACLAAVFQANPAGCPGGSVIGTATVHTPVLKNPLTGPAYLVSHGNAAFPDVEFVLQGEGITLILDGHTDIKNGITYSRFESAPDEPFTSFETTLPEGPHGILTAYASEKNPYELCQAKLTMPTQITAQDGAVIEQNNPISPTGCNNVLATKTHKPTRAQQLAKALTACRHKYKHTKAKRQACERAARKRHAAKTSSRVARRVHESKKKA